MDRRLIFKDGDLILRRNGSVGLYFKGNLLDIKSPNVLLTTIDKYNNKLEMEENEELSITQAWRFNSGKLQEIYNETKVIVIPVSKIAEVYGTESHMIEIVND